VIRPNTVDTARACPSSTLVRRRRRPPRPIPTCSTVPTTGARPSTKASTTGSGPAVGARTSAGSDPANVVVTMFISIVRA